MFEHYRVIPPSGQTAPRNGLEGIQLAVFDRWPRNYKKSLIFGALTLKPVLPMPRRGAAGTIPALPRALTSTNQKTKYQNA